MRAQTVVEYMEKRERADQALTRMMQLQERVKEHVTQLFHPQAGIKITSFPLLPGGLKVQDREGQSIVFYWDLLTGTVKQEVRR